MNEGALSVVIGLLESMEEAIKRGDWKVEGACDPDWSIERAESFLRRNGCLRLPIVKSRFPTIKE